MVGTGELGECPGGGVDRGWAATTVGEAPNPFWLAGVVDELATPDAVVEGLGETPPAAGPVRLGVAARLAGRVEGVGRGDVDRLGVPGAAFLARRASGEIVGPP
jgi:hypothetical protein